MLMRHKKSGGVYKIVMLAIQEDTLETVVVYSHTETGAIWTRPASEFFDGRFEVVLERQQATAPSTRQIQ